MGSLTTILYQFRSLRPTLKFESLKIPILGRHVTRTVWKHLKKGDYEEAEIFALKELIRPGDKVLELGCGMGVVTAVASKLFPGITIESYEANPALIDPVEELHILNGIKNVIVHNAILLPTDKTATRKFNLHRNFTQSSFLDEIDSDACVDVQVRDFRRVLREFSPDVLICDIEGGEEELFVGVDLAGIRAIVLEVHPELISRQAVQRIFDVCGEANLYLRAEFSLANVLAFERVTSIAEKQSEGNVG